MMMGGALMLKGKIVLVPFPFDDLSTTKVRPAVCLTERIGSYDHVVLGFISSRVPEHVLDSDCVFDSTSTDFPKTGLARSSTLRLHRLMTITTSIIRRELGQLSSGLQKDVDAKLRTLFGL